MPSMFRVDLPEYPSEDVLRDKLLQALSWVRMLFTESDCTVFADSLLNVAQ